MCVCVLNRMEHSAEIIDVGPLRIKVTHGNEFVSPEKKKKKIPSRLAQYAKVYVFILL